MKYLYVLEDIDAPSSQAKEAIIAAGCLKVEKLLRLIKYND